MLRGVTALVTGGSRGIGRACAADLARAGARVVVTSRDLAVAEAAAACLPLLRPADCAGGGGEGTGGLCHVGAQCDVRDEADVQRLFAQLKGGPGAADAPLGVVVNAAGVNHDGLLLRLRVDRITEMLDTNLLGTLLVSRAASRHLLRAASSSPTVAAGAAAAAGAGPRQGFRGCIVNIGSAVAAVGNTGQSAYAASKAGLEGLTRSLAKELGPAGVRVNCVEPGFIAADEDDAAADGSGGGGGGMTRGLPEATRRAYEESIALRRFGTPDEVAKLVTFLADPAQAGFITGQVLRVDGGM